jgi:uncharacterized protein DUF4203
MQLEGSGTSRVGPAENSCGHSSAATLLNIHSEPREAKPSLRGEAFYAVPANLSVPILGVIVGTAILLFGRKLFWLFVAALGFAVGIEIAAYFMRDPPVWMTLVIALGLGILGALLAIMLQKLAIAVAGFVAGGRLASALLAAFFADHAHYRGITFVIGGILGALLLLALFDWVLILLSSVEGAHLIGNGIVLPQTGAVIVFCALVLIGVIVQGSMLRGSRRAAD